MSLFGLGLWTPRRKPKNRLYPETLFVKDFMDVFSAKKWLPKKHKNFRTPGILPPPPYLRLSPKNANFLPPSL